MTALKKITAEAKRLRRKKPGMSWKSAVKQASVKYRTGKIAGVRRKKAVAKKRRRISGEDLEIQFDTPKRMTNVTHYAGGMVGTISQHKNAARRLIAEKMGWLDIQIMSAKTVAQKNKLKKRRAQLAKEARAMS